MLLRYVYSVIFCEETVVLISGVSKTQRRRRGLSFFKKECCFRVTVRVDTSPNPNPNPNPKTAFFFKTKKIDPDPDPAFY